MGCRHLEEFNIFQLKLMIQEAEESGNNIDTIHEGWINANSQTVREVFCEKLCPDRGICKEKINRKKNISSKKNARKI